jgi:four helix bundle protein
MKIDKFEDIQAWQKARKLNIMLRVNFKNCKDFNFKNQLERALISIMNNIAEGFERKTNNELKYFLFVAKGSCGEVRSMLYLGLDLKYISRENFKIAYNLSVEISKMLSGFIKKI